MALRFAISARALAALLVLTLAATSLPPVTAGDGRECVPGSAGASITNVAINGITLQTQVGSNTFVLPARAAFAASTTGVLDVDVTHRCVQSYTFSWTVVGQISGTTTGSVTMTPACAGGVDSHPIPVGNDVASVHMEVAWIGCEGTAGKDARDVTVCDPDLRL